MAAKKKPLWTNSALIVFLTIASLVVVVGTLYSSFGKIESVTDQDKNSQKEFKDLLDNIGQKKYPRQAAPDYAKMIQQNGVATPEYFTPNFLFYPAPVIKAKRMPVEAYFLGNLSVKATPDFDKITVNVSLPEAGQSFTRKDPNSKRDENYPHIDPRQVTIEIKPSGQDEWFKANPTGDNQWQYIDTKIVGRALKSYSIRAVAEFPDAKTMPEEIDDEHFPKENGRIVLLPTRVVNTYDGTVEAEPKRKYDIIIQPEFTGREQANLQISNLQTADMPESMNCKAGDLIGKTPYTVVCVANIKGGKILMRDMDTIEQIVMELEVYTSDNPTQAKTFRVEYYNDMLAATPLSNADMIKGALEDFRAKIKTQIAEEIAFSDKEKDLMEKSLVQAMETVRGMTPSATQILSQVVYDIEAPTGPRAGQAMMVAEIKGVYLGAGKTAIVHYAPAQDYKRRDQEGAADNKMFYYLQVYDQDKKRNTLYGPYEIKIGDKAISREAIVEEITKDIDYNLANAKNKDFPSKKPSGADKPKTTKNNYVPSTFAQYDFFGIPNSLGNFIIYSDLQTAKPTILYYAPNSPEPTKTKPSGKSADEIAREEIIAQLNEAVSFSSKIISNVTIAEAAEHLTSNWKGLKGDTVMDTSMEDVEDIRFDITLDDKTVTGRKFLDKIVESLNVKLRQSGSNMEVSYEIGAKIVFKAQRG